MHRVLTRLRRGQYEGRMARTPGFDRRELVTPAAPSHARAKLGKPPSAGLPSAGPTRPRGSLKGRENVLPALLEARQS